METELVCPLGQKCQTAENGVVKQCMWYLKLQGKNPQTGENVDKYDCAINWQVLLQVESNKTNNGVAQSVQSLRNETIKRQDVALGVMASAQRIKAE